MMASSTRRNSITPAAVLAATTICILAADRPLATFIQRQLFDTALYVFADGLLRVVGLTFVVAVALFVLYAVWAMFQRQRWARWAAYYTAPTAGLLALAVTELLKLLIGRTQVYPYYLVQHIYTFRPLAGGKMYMAFPSATAAVLAALLSVLWSRAPRIRIASATFAGTILLAVLITNGHWLSDIIAGAYLGWWVGFWVHSQQIRNAAIV